MDSLLHIQALLVRHSAAMKHLKDGTDPYDLLAAVVAPSPELRAYSEEQARTKPISNIAKQVHQTLASERKRGRGAAPLPRPLVRSTQPRSKGRDRMPFHEAFAAASDASL